MAAGEREARLLMARQRVAGWAVALHRVATLATVIVRRSGKLSGVRIRVAVRAARELDTVERGLARRRVTFLAGHSGVLALERIFRGRVFRQAEFGGLERLEGVAGSAVASVGPRAELSAMRIRFVAVGALCMVQRSSEISGKMAAAARHLSVPAEQREIRLRVVELSGQRDLLPTGGRMARGAGGGEGTLVRIGVASRAGVETNPLQLQRLARPRGRMAFLTGHRPMFPREGESRSGMIESRQRFPSVGRVTTLAILAQLPAMRILMASQTVARKSQESPAQILHADGCALGFKNAFRGVALGAFQPGMLALERIARLAVVKALQGRNPPDELKVFAVVLGMAACASFLVAFRNQRGMQPAPRIQTVSNLRVALQAAEFRGACAQLMTVNALCGAAEGLVRAGKRSRRNLPLRRKAQQDDRGT